VTDSTELGRISYKNANSNIGGVIRFLINSYHGAVGLDPKDAGALSGWKQKAE